MITHKFDGIEGLWYSKDQTDAFILGLHKINRMKLEIIEIKVTKIMETYERRLKEAKNENRARTS